MAVHDGPAASTPPQSPEECGGLGAGQLGGGGGGAGSGSGSSGGDGAGSGSGSSGPGEPGHAQWQSGGGLASGHAAQNGHGTDVPKEPGHLPPVCGSQSKANARSGTSAVQTSSANAFSR